MRPDDVVEVLWHDSYHSAPPYWCDPEDDETDPEPIRTVGIFVGLGRRYLLLAQSISSDEHGGRYRIPLATIDTVRSLDRKPRKSAP